MKIDVEGHEGRVLLGATETIKRDRPIIILEAHAKPETMETLWWARPPLEYLEKLGYRITRIDHMNCLALPG